MTKTRSEISAMGGRAAQAKHSHVRFTPEKARALGRRGGLALKEKRGLDHYAALGRKSQALRIERMRVKTLLDVDGVICNWLGAILDVANLFAHTSYTPSDIDQYDVFNWLKTRHPEVDDFGGKIWRTIKTEGFYAELPLYHGAQEFVEELRRHSHVVFVTATHFTSERTGWLERHFNAHADDIIIASGKHHIPGDVFIDDHVENVLKWKEAHRKGRGIVFHQSTNANVKVDLPRVTSYAEAIKHVEEVLNHKRFGHRMK